MNLPHRGSYLRFARHRGGPLVVQAGDVSCTNCTTLRREGEGEGDAGELERLRKGKYIPSRRIVHLGVECECDDLGVVAGPENTFWHSGWY